MPVPRKAKGMPDEPSLPGRCRHRAGLDPPSSVPTSNRSRRQLAAHPSAALISRVQNFRRKMCRTASAASSHSRPGDGLFARRTEGSKSRSLHRRVRELSVPPETKSDQDAKPRHSIPRKQSLIKPTPSHATFAWAVVRVRKICGLRERVGRRWTLG